MVVSRRIATRTMRMAAVTSPSYLVIPAAITRIATNPCSDRPPQLNRRQGWRHRELRDDHDLWFRQRPHRIGVAVGHEWLIDPEGNEDKQHAGDDAGDHRQRSCEACAGSMTR